MRIAIDLQACQSTTSRTRGIGRYSLALARAMVMNASHHEFWLMLSSQFPDTIPALCAEFAPLVRAERIRIYDPPGFRGFLSRQTRSPSPAGLLAEIVPDVVHITSPFEQEDMARATNEARILTAATVYDVIPLLYPKQYLQQGKRTYHRKLGMLCRANVLLAISDHTRLEVIEHLGIVPEKIVNISAGVDAGFRRQVMLPEEECSFRARMDLPRPFIMYAGALDWRKNVTGFVAAFGLLAKELRECYQLAIVGPTSRQEKTRLAALMLAHGLRSEQFRILGYVSDKDLVTLYSLCDLFVLASFHEGFGLPVAEAMACGAPTLGSNTTSIPEVIGREDALFDPRQPETIAAAIDLALTNEAFRQSLRSYGPSQARKFTWHRSALRALRAIEGLGMPANLQTV